MLFFIKSDQEKAKVFDMVERFAIKGGRDFFLGDEMLNREAFRI